MRGPGVDRGRNLRTLVISDFHLGNRLGRDVLRRPEPLRKLLAAVDGIDRLVLLGDVLELMSGRRRQSMSIAEPVLREIGARLGPRRQVVLVPGNHDAPLVRAFVRAHPDAIGPDTAIPLDASPALTRVSAWLWPAEVRVHYPGVWLRERVWATHGHYLDRHLMPESAFGVWRGLIGSVPDGGARPIDYERTRRPSLARASRTFPRPAASLLDDVAELIRASTMPRVQRALLHRRLAPLTSGLLGLQMRRASIPALARVAHRLGVDADWVIFGHVHRAGPLAREDASLWQGPGGWPRVLNTGSWVYEPLLVHRAQPPHPYWPGGAVLLEPGAEPRALGLLDELSPSELR